MYHRTLIIEEYILYFIILFQLFNNINISNFIRYLNFEIFSNYYFCNNGDFLHYVLFLNACILY